MTRLSADWLDAPATQAVARVLTEAGYHALFVGGCVRNTLLEAPVTDIDISTEARPERVLELAEQAGLKAIPTGIDHGTVTVVAEGLPHEITTFRRDVETFGRRAVVAFTDRIEEDAKRRDFTMNALYAAPDGTLRDPLGGFGDLQARRVRFILDPEARIREDYLRILRFFRFHAWYGDPTGGLDADGLAACAAHSDGLENLSRERVGGEMKKLLAAPDPAPSVAAMQASGCLAHVLHGADARGLPVLVHLEAEANARPDPIRRLAVLGGEDVAARLRLSRAEAKTLSLYRAGLESTAAPVALAYRHGAEVARSTMLLRSALLETSLPEDLEAQIALGVQATFPVKPADLMPDVQGEALGARLKELEARWLASGLTLSKAELLA